VKINRINAPGRQKDAHVVTPTFPVRSVRGPCRSLPPRAKRWLRRRLSVGLREGKLRVGFNSEKPFAYVDESGKATGFALENGARSSTQADRGQGDRGRRHGLGQLDPGLAG